jgi:hypothetical protein
VISAKPASGPSLLAQVLIGFGPTLLFIGLLVYVFRRGAAGMGAGMTGMGRSKASSAPPWTRSCWVPRATSCSARRRSAEPRSTKPATRSWAC